MTTAAISSSPRGKESDKSAVTRQLIFTFPFCLVKASEEKVVGKRNDAAKAPLQLNFIRNPHIFPDKFKNGPTTKSGLEYSAKITGEIKTAANKLKAAILVTITF